jgi:RsiW-degrading membrane proteinase PrsW (M82 family)
MNEFEKVQNLLPYILLAIIVIVIVLLICEGIYESKKNKTKGELLISIVMSVNMIFIGIFLFIVLKIWSYGSITDIDTGSFWEILGVIILAGAVSVAFLIIVDKINKENKKGKDKIIL